MGIIKDNLDLKRTWIFIKYWKKEWGADKEAVKQSMNYADTHVPRWTPFTRALVDCLIQSHACSHKLHFTLYLFPSTYTAFSFIAHSLQLTIPMLLTSTQLLNLSSSSKFLSMEIKNWVNFHKLWPSWEWSLKCFICKTYEGLNHHRQDYAQVTNYPKNLSDSQQLFLTHATFLPMISISCFIIYLETKANREILSEILLVSWHRENHQSWRTLKTCAGVILAMW